MNRRTLIIIGGIAAAGLLLFLITATGRSISGMKAAKIYKDALSLKESGNTDAATAALERLLKKYPRANISAKASLDLAGLYEGQGHLLKAKGIYDSLLAAQASVSSAKAARKRLEDLNVKILFSPIRTPDSKMYTVKSGDTLQKIAARFGTTAALIRKANELQSNIIRVGKDLKVPTNKFSMIVDKSRNILTLKSDEKVFKTYQVATGKSNSTPVGNFKVINKLTDPVWYTAGAIVPSGSPKNILGSRWLGLNISGYGIHGTTEDESIGRQVTQGCIRMHNKDAEELYDIIPSQTEVIIVD